METTSEYILREHLPMTEPLRKFGSEIDGSTSLCMQHSIMDWPTLQAQLSDARPFVIVLVTTVKMATIEKRDMLPGLMDKSPSITSRQGAGLAITLSGDDVHGAAMTLEKLPVKRIDMVLLSPYRQKKYDVRTRKQIIGLGLVRVNELNDPVLERGYEMWSR